MEHGGRKLLPRVQPPVEHRPDGIEAVRNGNRTTGVHEAVHNQVWRSPMREDSGPKRKRQHLEDPHVDNQALPSVRALLNPAMLEAKIEPEERGHARLIAVSSRTYFHEGLFKFQAPPPSRDFPKTLSEDLRPLSFTVVEPELMNVFRQTWYLRQYIRLKRLRGESWLDHIWINDCFGVDNILRTWTSRYEPGMLQYPASILYHQCLWLFFHRSVQASQASPALAEMVNNGMHYARSIENALGPSADRSILLLPLFLLGASAFHVGQRREVWEALNRLDPTYNDESVNHAVKSLDRIWSMMDEGRASETWDWERLQAHEHNGAARDRSLMDLLTDSLAPVAQPPPGRSPEQYEFDPSRFRASQPQQRPPSRPQPHPPPPPYPAPSAQPPPPVIEPVRPRSSHEFYTPIHTRSPRRNLSVVSVDGRNGRDDDGHHAHRTPPGATSAPPQTSLAPVPTHPLLTRSPMINHAIENVHRKPAKPKSHIPPCSACGKELKNPSDAQKHQLQHSKPFRCREPGCTRSQGFATENDLQRHRKSVHGASPAIGNKIGYVCAACPDPSDGTSRKWWPRLDNFKAHIRRKHQDQDEEALINASASASRTGDGTYIDGGYYESSYQWAEDAQHEQDGRHEGEYGPRYRESDGHENDDTREGEYRQYRYGNADHYDSEDEAEEDGHGNGSSNSKSDSLEEGDEVTPDADAMEVSPTENPGVADAVRGPDAVAAAA